jgi:WD repeat-containing protein 48
MTPSEVLLSGTLSPPPSVEAPTCNLPPNTTLLISEEASPSFTTVYRGTVASTKHDIRVLEEAMPMWLIEYLLMNKIPPVSALMKISFVLMPWPAKDPEERLPELLNTSASFVFSSDFIAKHSMYSTQSKLTASRYLRVRKLVFHVCS